jgi:hypothetical protein
MSNVVNVERTAVNEMCRLTVRLSFCLVGNLLSIVSANI